MDKDIISHIGDGILRGEDAKRFLSSIGENSEKDSEDRKNKRREAFENYFALKFIQDDEAPIFTRNDMYDFADWYCNGLLNSERGTPKEMFPKYAEDKLANSILFQHSEKRCLEMT